MTTTTDSERDDASEVEAGNSQRRLIARILWVLLALALSGIAYSQLTRVDVLPIQQVKVSGEFQQLKTQDFQLIVKDGIDGNFFTINVSDMYQKLIALPWVEKVWIHRIWPDTLKINLQEQVPIAVLKDVGLLNQYGEAFSQDVAYFEQTLPLFVVAKNYTQESVKQYQKALEILQDNKFQVRVFYYNERKSQTIKLSNGIELVLGRVDIEKRLMKFVKAYKTRLQYDERKIEKVDLRYTNGLAVKWAGKYEAHASLSSDRLEHIRQENTGIKL